MLAITTARPLLTAAALTGLALVACRRQDISVSSDYPNLHFTAAEPRFGDDAILWQAGGLALASEVLRPHWPGKVLAMLTVAAGSAAERTMQTDRRVIARVAPDTGGWGRVLVAVDTIDELAPLAAMAHEQRHDAIACGQLEVITGFALAEPSGSPLPPIFRDSVKLDSVADAISAIDKGNIADQIKTLANLGTRHYRQASGLAAPATIQSFADSAAGSAIAGYTSSLFDHSSSQVLTSPPQQKSVVISIPGTADDSEIVIIGAHLDSINRLGNNDDAPGADDDASGVAVILEMIRVIAESSWQFDRRIEFHLYAAEEVGLWGSTDIAKSYAAAGKSVAGMLQFDMVSYSTAANGNNLFLVSTDTSPGLRRTAANLMNTYFGGGYLVKALSAGTSDHKSWKNAGFHVVFPFEDPEAYNTALHTPGDTFAAAGNTALAARFAGLGLAFAAHVGGLRSATREYATAAAREALDDDLKVAVQGPSASNQYALAIAAPVAVSAVEVCRVTEATATGCAATGERYAGSPLGMANRRNFFAFGTVASGKVTSGLPLAADETWRVFGFSSSDVLTWERTLRFARN
jgi:bacterial leucyl aminopeptidase